MSSVGALLCQRSTYDTHTGINMSPRHSCDSMHSTQRSLIIIDDHDQCAHPTVHGICLAHVHRFIYFTLRKKTHVFYIAPGKYSQTFPDLARGYLFSIRTVVFH